MTFANIITIGRLFFIIPAMYCLLKTELNFSILWIVVFLTFDAVDGFIARSFERETKLGIILDPLVDKFFFIPLLFALTGANLTPVWFVVAVCIREFILLLGVFIFLMTKKTEVYPSKFIGKLTIFMYSICCILSMLRFQHILYVYILTCLIILASLIDYLYFGTIKLCYRTS